MMISVAALLAFLPGLGSEAPDVHCLSPTLPSDGAPIPEGITASDWISVRAAHETWSYAARSVDGGFEAANPGQDWLTRFDGRGFLAQPNSNEWSWGLELTSFGTAGEMQSVATPTCLEAQAGEVRYQWTDSLVEWYVNDQRGLEHGYTLQQRPAILETSARDQHLQLNLGVRGGLTPEVQASGLAVSFLDSSGNAALTYSGLTVFDTTGREFPAWFELCEDGAADLRLFVDELGAEYPLTIDPVAQQEAYFKASNPDVSDRFGVSVSVSGDRLVVGASAEDSNATGVNGLQSDDSAANSGAAYVFVRDSGTGDWTQEAYLKASNTDMSDAFGGSVSISGDRLVVGAALEASSATGVNSSQSDNSLTFPGAAYIFVRDTVSGVWSQEAYVKASNTGDRDFFGASVSLCGDRLAVGARHESSSATGVNGVQTDNSAIEAGAVYVFARNVLTGAWSQEAYLKASNTQADDWFGISVSLESDRLVVGASQEDSSSVGVNGLESDNSAIESGAAYVFVRDNMSGTWSQEAYLKASNTGTQDAFGRGVSLSDDRLVVSASRESSNATGVNGLQSDNSASRSGAAYVFARDTVNGIWSQEAYLKASNTNANDAFGNSVSLSGNRLAIGAEGEDSNATGVNGPQSDNSADRAGAVYLFVRDVVSGNWSQEAYLKATNTDPIDLFGASISLSDDCLFVGARAEDSNATGVNGDESDNSTSSSGAGYLFDLSPPSFANQCNGDGGDQVGCTDCPCSNNTALGTTGGCINSAGTGSRLIASGSGSVSLPATSTDDLRFVATNGPAFQLFILNSGDALAPNSPANPCFGLGSGLSGSLFDGLRCAIVNTLRNGGRGADANGEVGFTNQPWGGEGNPPGGIAQFFGYISGTTKFFQCIHRDSAAVNCGTGLNTTQAVEVTFIP